MGYGPFVKFDHDFIGREALEKIAGRPQRRKVTFAWNADEVIKDFKSLFEPGKENYKYIDLPLSGNYTSASYDRVHVGGKTVGLSMFAGYSYNERSMLSLGVVDPDIALGNEVTLLWGEEGGGSQKTTVERHRQIEIRAIVSPVPYSKVAREEYAAGWRTALKMRPGCNTRIDLRERRFAGLLRAAECPDDRHEGQRSEQHRRYHQHPSHGNQPNQRQPDRELAQINAAPHNRNQPAGEPYFRKCPTQFVTATFQRIVARQKVPPEIEHHRPQQQRCEARQPEDGREQRFPQQQEAWTSSRQKSQRARADPEKHDHRNGIKLPAFRDIENALDNRKTRRGQKRHELRRRDKSLREPVEDQGNDRIQPDVQKKAAKRLSDPRSSTRQFPPAIRDESVYNTGSANIVLSTRSSIPPWPCKRSLAVFHARAPLDRRFRQIAYLAGHIRRQRKEPGHNRRDVPLTCEQEDTSGRTGTPVSPPTPPAPSQVFAWTDTAGASLYAASEILPHVVRAGIANPVHHQPEHQPMMSGGADSERLHRLRGMPSCSMIPVFHEPNM